VSTTDSSPPDDGWHDEAPSGGMPTRRSSVGALVGAGFNAHGPRLLLDGSGVTFRIWAEGHQKVDLILYGRASEHEAPHGPPPREERRLRMTPQADGFFATTVRGIGSGALYAFEVDGEGPFPDPASRRQPYGVHGPSQVVNLAALPWTDAEWRGVPIEDLVLYEVHVGTATREGTFRALIDKLDHIRALGATAIELMPIAEFPGARNWGYDGVGLFAPSRAYGSPADLAALVDAAHARGLAVILDVVFNHLGPDGNYLSKFTTRYFAPEHHTPWGPSFNFYRDGSAQVRTFLLENVEMWVRELHFDGLRLDSTHHMVDSSEHHILSALADCARAAASGREVLIIAEDERNEARMLREVSRGGLGLDAVWADDFHHSLRRIVAGDDEGYYRDFAGDPAELVKILKSGWYYEGQSSIHWNRPRGTPAFDIPPPRLIHAIQNHDQIGNRAEGDRLHHRVPLPRVRAATMLLLASPFTPLLFMGQEFAASAPFAFFTDHHPELGKQVTAGRRAEFAEYRAFSDAIARQRIPDPQAIATFLRSKLDWSEAVRPAGAAMVALHQALLAFRRDEPAMQARARADLDVELSSEGVLTIRRTPRDAGDPSLLYCVWLREGGAVSIDGTPARRPPKGRRWEIVLDTESPTYGGEAPAKSDGHRLSRPTAGGTLLKSV
jgi:maltooligosyltrehalose trehalohydrolase